MSARLPGICRALGLGALLLGPAVPTPAQFGETLEVSAPSEPGPSVLIAREELGKLPAGDLHQVLALLLPGGVARRSPFGVQADARIRGAGFESVQVFVDGVPVADPQTGHFTLDLPVRPEAVESIEVVPRAWTTAPGDPIAGGATTTTSSSTGTGPTSTTTSTPASGRGRRSPGRPAVRLRLDANNLFDAGYQERRSVDMPGRWVSAGVTAGF